MSTTSINLLSGGLLQGTIDGEGGFLPNTTRVIMTNRIALPDYLGRKYIISAATSTGKTINTDFVGYADSTTQMFVYDSDWQSNPKTYDLSSQTSTNYFRIVLKYSDNSTILPEEITALTISDTAIFHAAEGQYPINNLTPPVLQTDFRRPFPSSLWRIDDNNNGYPYTALPLGNIYVAPTPPEPPIVDDPIIGQGWSEEVTDTTSLPYERFNGSGYTNPDLIRFQDREFVESTIQRVGIFGVNSYRYMETDDYEDGSTTCEVP